MTNSTESRTYHSDVIRERVARMLENNQSIEEFIGPLYSRDVKECLDIIDIDYPVTAVGILGRSLEICIKEYCNKKLKNKMQFSLNTANNSIGQIKTTLSKANHKNRINLLNQKKIKIDGKEYLLKNKLIRDRYYNLLDEIREARNDAFHGCDSDDYGELAARGYNLIEQGIVLLIALIKDMDR